MTVSGSPYRACVSMRPVSPRRVVVDMDWSHWRTRTGDARAGASTARGEVGDTHNVATDTDTNTCAPGVSGVVCGRTVWAVVADVGALPMRRSVIAQPRPTTSHRARPTVTSSR